MLASSSRSTGKRAEIPYHAASQPRLELIGQDVVALPAPFPPPGRGVPVFGQVSLVLRTVSVAVRAIRRPGASVPRTYGGQRRRGECHSAAFAQVRGYVMGTGSSGL